jgi:ubiquinone/menaquinone biosynthesis C-methylase UbiE
MGADVQSYWDAQAPTFDEEPDHGLLDGEVRAAWADLLIPLLPTVPSSIADIGCGTGSLSVLLAESGHSVCGLDISGEMIAIARNKARTAGSSAAFVQGDAAAPPLPPASFDVVLARHVLWALADPAAALRRWAALLKPHGSMLLIEGRWSTGAGLTAAESRRLVQECRDHVEIRRLADPALWGKRIDDERYLLISRG